MLEIAAGEVVRDRAGPRRRGRGRRGLRRLRVRAEGRRGLRASVARRTLAGRRRHELERPADSGRHPAVGQRRLAEGCLLARQDGVHRRVQGARHGISPRAQAQHRRRRPGRSRWARRRAARRVRLPDRVVPVLGAGAGAKRLRPRAVRRELHDPRTERRQRLHRRPLSDRHRRLRGHAAPCHLLPRRDPDERPAHSGPARVPPPPRLLLPRARGGRRAGRRRDREARVRP